MKVSLISAIADNGVIGRDNDLPWKVKDDMRFFVQKTKGHTVITGRANYDAMGRALPHRLNLVISRDQSLVLPDATVVSSVEEALRLARSAGETEAFVIGGAQVYALALPYAHTFYRTRILSEVAGDVVFPPYDASEFTVTELARHPTSDVNEHACVIEELTRKSEPRDYAPGESTTTART